MKKQKDASAVTSRLISSPIRRMFPVFLLPMVAAFAIGFVWPFIQGIYLSFCQFRTTSDAKFIGLGNYLKALQDPTFLHSFWYTALYALVSLVLINVLAFTVAYALTQKIKPSFCSMEVLPEANVLQLRKKY